MLSSVLTVARLPSKAVLQILKSSLSPQVISSLSTAIARGSIASAGEDQSIEVDGFDVEIKLDDERLLATGGVATVISMGSLYWIGSRLRIEFRYAAMISALEDLKRFLAIGDASETTKTLNLIDTLSNPLVDPETFKTIENADEVKVVYEALFNRPAERGSMFRSGAFVSSIDDSIKTGSRAAILLASSQTDEVLEVMVKKAKPLAGKVVGRIVGAVLWVDTVYWVATSALDLGLNYTGVAEENQRIPILSDIPYIGGMFDLSDSVGASAVDLVLSPIIDGIANFFAVEDELENLIEAVWSLILSAALNPTLTPFIIGVLDFYIEEVGITFGVPTMFDISTDFKLDAFDYLGFRPEPLDILIVWLYAIVLKIVFRAWLEPIIKIVISK
jgi:hypothetical protein